MTDSAGTKLMDLLTADPASAPSTADPPSSLEAAAGVGGPPTEMTLGERKSKRATLVQTHNDTISAAKAAFNPVRTNIMPQKQKKKNMVPPIVTLLCCWGGRTKNGPAGIEYDGGPPMALRVGIDITLQELRDKIYALLGWDDRQFELEITCRLLVGLQPLRFVPLPIVDDSSVSAMFDMIRDGQQRCIELYLHNRPRDGHVSPIILSGLQTQQLESQSNAPAQRSGGIRVPGLYHTGGSSSRQADTVPSFTPTMEPVNLDIMPEMTASEDVNMFDCAVRNNDLVDDESDVDVDEDCENDDQSEESGNGEVHNVPKMNDIAPPQAMYTEPPIPEIANVSCINDAVSTDNHGGLPPPTGVDLYVGQVFLSKAAVVNAVKTFHIKNYVQFKVTHSSRSLVALKCKLAPQCPWSLRASFRKRKGFFVISSLKSSHTCRDTILNRDHVQLDSNFVANHIFATVKANVKMNIAAIQAMINADFNYEISYSKAWAARKKVITRLFGTTHPHIHMDSREGPQQLQCGLCKEKGHNRRSCRHRARGGTAD